MDKLAVGVDIEAWDFDIPFLFEFEAFDVARVEESLDVVTDFVAGIFIKGFSDIFYKVLCFSALPNSFDRVQDRGFIASFEAFERKEEVRLGGVEFCNSEGDRYR